MFRTSSVRHIPRITEAKRYYFWLMHPEQASHLFLCMILIMFGQRLWQPNYVFAPAFSAMAALASAPVWSCIFVTVGGIGLSGLFLHNFWYRNFGIFILSVAHVVIAVLFWQAIEPGGLVTTACTTYGCIASFGFHSLWWRIRAR